MQESSRKGLLKRDFL